MDVIVDGAKVEIDVKKSRADNANRPSRSEAEAAVRTLIAWAGDNPDREGLLDTPERVARAYEEFFAGYEEDPEEVLSRTFEEVEGYNDMVMLRGISFESHCEHHMAPIIGKAHVAYMPDGKVVGISKLARVVELYAKRLQIQERMTVQIGEAIDRALGTRGVAVMIDAEHQCMSTRGVHKHDVGTITTHFSGVFKEDSNMEQRFLTLTQSRS